MKCQHKVLTEEKMAKIRAQLDSPPKSLKYLAQETLVLNEMREQTQNLLKLWLNMSTAANFCSPVTQQADYISLIVIFSQSVHSGKLDCKLILS
jgi:hypothetical protein